MIVVNSFNVETEDMELIYSEIYSFGKILEYSTDDTKLILVSIIFFGNWRVASQ